MKLRWRAVKPDIGSGWEATAPIGPYIYALHCVVLSDMFGRVNAVIVHQTEGLVARQGGLHSEEDAKTWCQEEVKKLRQRYGNGPTGSYSP